MTAQASSHSLADPIVLIHGFPFDAAMWEPQARALRQKGHTVLTPNLPGFGQPPESPAPRPAHASIEAYAEFIRDLIVAQPTGRAVVGGFSMGGYITLALLRDFPEVVRAAMLVDTRADPDTPDARATRLKSIEEIKSAGTGPLVETMLAKLLSKHATPALKDRLRALMMRQSVETAIAAQTAMSRRHDQNDLLAELKIPLLIVVGAEDTITPPSVAMAMHNHVPHSMLVQITRAGHLANQEQPEAVTKAMETFLATVR